MVPLCQLFTLSTQQFWWILSKLTVKPNFLKAFGHRKALVLLYWTSVWYLLLRKQNSTKWKVNKVLHYEIKVSQELLLWFHTQESFHEIFIFRICLQTFENIQHHHHDDFVLKLFYRTCQRLTRRLFIKIFFIIPAGTLKSNLQFEYWAVRVAIYKIIWNFQKLCQLGYSCLFRQ